MARPVNREPTAPEPPPPGVGNSDPPPRGLVLAVGLVAVALLVTLVAVGSGSTGDSLRDVAADDETVIRWQTAVPPEGPLRVESLQVTSSGFVLLSGPAASGATLWSSPDGSSWTASGLDEIPAGIAGDGTSLIAFRDYDSVQLDWNGQRWVETARRELPTFTRVGYLSGRPAVIATEHGLLVHSVEGELFHGGGNGRFDLVIEQGEWWSPSEDLWERFTAPAVPTACRPPVKGSLDFPPILDAAAGLVAFVPLEKSSLNLTWPVCDPELWLSTNGAEWSVAGGESGFEPGSYVYEVAGREGRLVAVGGRGSGEPTVWVSEDGLHWSVLNWDPGVEGFMITDVVAGNLGYVILGQATTGQDRLAWYSSDGACWQRLPDHVGGVAAAIGSDRIVVVDRLRSTELRPELWVGVPENAATSDPQQPPCRRASASP